jgi:hypothetical protein
MGLRLQVDRQPPAGWDDAIREAGGTLFQTEAWAPYRCHAGRGDPLFCRWVGAAGENVAYALGIRLPSRASRVGRLVGRVVFDTPPARQAHGDDLIGPLRGWARRSPELLDIELGSFDAHAPWTVSDPPEPVHRLELERSVDRDEAALLASFSHGQRSNLKKAAKLGVVAEAADGPDALLRFAGLVGDTARSLERRKGVTAAQDDADALGASLGELVGRGCGRLWLARRDGEAEAGVFFGRFDNSAYYLFSGARDTARDLAALPAAMALALRELAAGGVTRVNLGGVRADAPDPGSPDHGLLKFKTGFGGEPVFKIGGHIALRPRRARAVARLRALTRR